MLLATSLARVEMSLGTSGGSCKTCFSIAMYRNPPATHGATYVCNQAYEINGHNVVWVPANPLALCPDVDTTILGIWGCCSELGGAMPTYIGCTMHTIMSPYALALHSRLAGFISIPTIFDLSTYHLVSSPMVGDLVKKR